MRLKAVVHATAVDGQRVDFEQFAPNSDEWVVDNAARRFHVLLPEGHPVTVGDAFVLEFHHVGRIKRTEISRAPYFPPGNS